MNASAAAAAAPTAPMPMDESKWNGQLAACVQEAQRVTQLQLQRLLAAPPHMPSPQLVLKLAAGAAAAPPPMPPPQPTAAPMPPPSQAAVPQPPPPVSPVEAARNKVALMLRDHPPTSHCKPLFEARLAYLQSLFVGNSIESAFGLLDLTIPFDEKIADDIKLLPLLLAKALRTLTKLEIVFYQRGGFSAYIGEVEPLLAKPDFKATYWELLRFPIIPRIVQWSGQGPLFRLELDCALSKLRLCIDSLKTFVAMGEGALALLHDYQSNKIMVDLIFHPPCDSDIYKIFRLKHDYMATDESNKKFAIHLDIQKRVAALLKPYTDKPAGKK